MDMNSGTEEPSSAKLALPLSEDDRFNLERNHAICTDPDGKETLVGLTRDESTWLLAFVNRSSADKPNAEVRDQYLHLYERHERARLSALASRRMPANDT